MQTETYYKLKWVNRFAPLYRDPARKIKECDMIYGTLVKPTELLNGSYEQVIHVTANGSVIGWVHVDDVEDYFLNLATNVVVIENKTPQLTDFEQYIMYKSYKQVNMCGQLCVSYILGISLGTFLGRWEGISPSFFRRIFGEGKARGTSDLELIEMFKLFGRDAEPLSRTLYQSHIGRARYTIKNLSYLLGRGSVVIRVHIDKNTGLVYRKGVPHWVVLTTILPERNGQGFVTYYNPAMNSMETSSWREFMESAGSTYGVFTFTKREEAYSLG